MTRFRLTRVAETDLEDLVRHIEHESGPERARAVLADLLEAALLVADAPGAGHPRPDLTEAPVRFWSVHRFLVVYRPETRPVEIVRILHGARSPGVLGRAVRGME